ncbi:MAG: RsmB/NOP family class I SAM-dependent RNA methyltransferase [Thermoplasmata archaeon]|nr:RsmB/NOP family class I SAM-dependent RNA methyltransferase [Thermoplasmata archaeon]
MNGLREALDAWASKYEGYLDTGLLVDSILEPLRPSARVNLLRISREELIGDLEGWGIGADPSPYYGRAVFLEGDPGKLPHHALGLYYLQEHSAMFPVVVLDPRPGERILDMTAAPGGKATQIAEHIGNLGTVVAVERSRRRIKALRANVDRMGAVSVMVVQGDARSLGFREAFDRVLLDPPCSSESSLRKDPWTLPSVRRNDPETLSRLQRSLVRAAWRYLRPGGTLVYSTCTFDPRENEGVVSYAVELGFRTLRVDLPFPHERGFREYRGLEFDPSVSDAARIMPYHGPFAGMFIAHLLKI